jgi:hypothetical protein
MILVFEASKYAIHYVIDIRQSKKKEEFNLFSLINLNLFQKELDLHFFTFFNGKR